MELFSEINWSLIAPLILIQFLLMIIALVDFLKNRHNDKIHIAWIFLIVFVGTIGPILYFIFGRRN